MWSWLLILYAVGSPSFPWLTSVCPVCSWYVPCSSICWIDALLGGSPVTVARGLVAAVCMPAPFLGWDFRRDCEILGSMGETNVTTVISSAGIAVSGACWHCAWHQWYEVCGSGSGVEAVPLPPCLHHGFVCHFALCGLWIGVASIPVRERVICPVPGLRLWCHGHSGGW